MGKWDKSIAAGFFGSMVLQKRLRQAADSHDFAAEGMCEESMPNAGSIEIPGRDSSGFDAEFIRCKRLSSSGITAPKVAPAGVRGLESNQVACCQVFSTKISVSI
jgi:hypothetical protein